jgi:GAF domain-containing protein
MTSPRKVDFYRTLTRQAEGLLSGEADRVANAANLSALLWMELDDINWVGFYFARGDELVLGPFQGKPACVRIPVGEGVCGHAAAQRRTLRVDDVHAFDGHIACDVASNAEVVVPLVKDGTLIGVLDVDSPVHARFDDEDAAGLEDVARVFVDSVDP